MKKSTKIIIAVVSVLLIVVAVLAVLYFTTDIFNGLKKPRTLFYEYLDKATAIEKEDISYEKMIAKIKKVQNETYAGSGKISMDVKLGSTLEEYEEIATLLNNLEVAFEAKVDPKNTNAYTSMNAKYQGEDLGTIELVTNKEEIGLRFAEMYDKYLTISMDEILQEMDVDTDVLASLEDIDVNKVIEILEISDDEISRIIDRYKEVLKKEVPEDKYTKTEKTITINGEELKAEGYTLEVTQKDFARIAKAVLESLKEDDATIDLVVDKVNKAMDLAGEQSSKITTSDVKDILEDALYSVENTAEDNLSDEKLKITIYQYKDEPVRIELALGEDAIIFDKRTNGDTTNMAIKMKTQGEEITLANIEQTKTGEGKYTTKVSTEIEGITLEITADTEETETKSVANMSIYVEIPSIIEATLNIEAQTDFTSVDIDELTSSNSVEINSLTEAESTQLAYGLLDYVDQHMDVIKNIATILGYESEIEELETQINALKSQSMVTEPTVSPEDDTNDVLDVPMEY